MSSIRKIHLAEILGCLLALLVTAGCNGKHEVLYISDVQPGITVNVQDPRPIKLQPGDKLNINVYSRDKELVEMFNLSTSSTGMSGTTGTSGNTYAAYTVDDNGQIDMPIIGSVRVQGLTRMELQNTIRYKLLATKLVRDPIVNVQFVDVGYYTLGEIGAAKHQITRDHITLLEAIAECGDINIGGRKEKILVLRTVDGQQTPYRVDVTKMADLYSSPVYYLQQNDVIYVEPDELTIDQHSLYGNALKTPTFWIGMFNTALSICLIFMK